eukprot:TRINITY_DN9059_c1_g1_i1.p1 TRINITY_DN9059_c1_g1~~TRINITY_DN9059_c1_g1_i1.p1  ORF type:complete len:724 (-),score=243.29 TRINITY_DN9059_c1_g1_i1:73-2244(-)
MLTGGRDKVFNIWDVSTRALRRTVPTLEEVEALVGLGPLVEFIETPGLLPPHMAPKLDKLFKQDPDAALIASGGQSGQLKLWVVGDIAAECVWTEDKRSQPDMEVAPSVPEPTYQIGRLCYCSLTRTIISCTTDANIFIYSLDTLTRTKQIVGSHGEILDVKYINEEVAPKKKKKQKAQSNNEHDDDNDDDDEDDAPVSVSEMDRRVVLATNTEEIRVLNLATSNCQFLYGHKDIVICVDVSRDGSTMVSGSKDRDVRVWSLKTMSCVSVCSGHAEPIGAVVVAKKGAAFVVSVSHDLTLKIWDIRASHPKASATVRAHAKDINTVAVAPNDRLIATGSQDKTIKLWDPSDLREVGVLRGHTRGVWSVDFSPVDQVLVSASGDHTVRLWSLTSFACLKTLEGHTGSVLRATFLSFGLQVMSAAADGLLKLWTIKTNECVCTMDVHTEKIWAFAVHPSESQVVSGGGDSVLAVWKDYTIIDEEVAQRTNEDRILQEQKLDGLLRAKNYKKALMIAFHLQQPGHILNIFTSIYSEGGQEETANVVQRLKSLYICKLLGYIRDWNTTSRNSGMANRILHALLTSYTPQRLLDITKGEVNMRDILGALIPYTERHFARTDRLLQKSYIIDYTLENMNNMVLPVLDADSEMSSSTAPPSSPLQSSSTSTSSSTTTTTSSSSSSSSTAMITAPPSTVGAASSKSDGPGLEEDEDLAQLLDLSDDMMPPA